MGGFFFFFLPGIFSCPSRKDEIQHISGRFWCMKRPTVMCECRRSLDLRKAPGSNTPGLGSPMTLPAIASPHCPLERELRSSWKRLPSLLGRGNRGAINPPQTSLRSQPSLSKAKPGKARAHRSLPSDAAPGVPPAGSASCALCIGNGGGMGCCREGGWPLRQSAVRTR